ncbi:CAAX amino terminal protease, partial [Klenkia terrae]
VTAPVTAAPVRHPWLWSVAVAVGWRAVVVVAALGLSPMAVAAFPDLGAVVVNLLACAVPLAVVARLGWWRMPWLREVRPRAWWPLAPLAVVYAARIVFGWELGPVEAMSTVVLVLVAATSEELWSRGVVQELLRAVRPLWRAVAVGVLFGVGHVLSGVVLGRELDYLAFQVPHATIQGFALAALRMHVVSIWPLVGLHALSNLLVLAEAPGAVPVWWEAGQLLLTLAFGLWLVLRYERRPVEVSAPAGR